MDDLTTRAPKLLWAKLPAPQTCPEAIDEVARAPIPKPETERYGRLKVSKIRAAYNDLRAAVRSGEIEAANEALDRYEQWADFVFDERHRDPDATP